MFLQVSLEAKAGLVGGIIIYNELTWGLSLSPWVKRKMDLTYSTAVDIAHEVDRLAAFFIIILGEFVYSIIVGSKGGIGLTAGYAKAVATLVIAFCLNWIYVTGDGSLQALHPIRRSSWTAFAFFLLHLPLSMSFLIGGHIAAVGVNVEEFDEGQRWLLGGGLGIGMFALWTFAMLFRSDDEGELIMPRWLRVSMRLAVAVALLILPKTHDHLNATQLVFTIMGLFAFVTLWETIGGLLKNAQVFEPWHGRHPPQTNGNDAEYANDQIESD